VRAPVEAALPFVKGCLDGVDEPMVRSERWISKTHGALSKPRGCGHFGKWKIILWV